MNRIEQLLQFLKENPKDNFVRHSLALEYIKLGYDLKARILFEEILNDSPEYIGSYYHLAKLLERQNQIDLATEWYEKGMAAAKKANDMRSYNELQAAYEDLIY
jgi:Tfp pilus assembly protein PilF